jgi:hypothetical protein
MNGKLTAAVLLGVSLLQAPALAGGWGGGGGSASGSDGDWALRDELKNPRQQRLKVAVQRNHVRQAVR